MKCRTYRSATVIIGLVSLLFWTGCAAPERPEKAGWRVLQGSSYGGKFSYDPGSLKPASPGTVTLQAATESAQYLYELDCKNRKARILEKAESSSAWMDIAAGSAEELLYDAVCR
jgi:hypothetical protein